MAAERGAGQQQSQEMMEGERLHRAATERPGGRGRGRRPCQSCPGETGRPGPSPARPVTSASRQGGGGPRQPDADPGAEAADRKSVV